MCINDGVLNVFAGKLSNLQLEGILYAVKCVKESAKGYAPNVSSSVSAI